MPTFRNIPESMKRAAAVPKQDSKHISTLQQEKPPLPIPLCHDALPAPSSQIIDRKSAALVTRARQQQPTPEPSPGPAPRPKSNNKRKKGDPNHINRPSNCYMLFRTWAIKNGKTAHLTHQADISKHVSHLWNNVDADTRDTFVKRAAEEKRLHNEMYPDYKYAPNKKDAAPPTSEARRPRTTAPPSKKARTDVPTKPTQKRSTRRKRVAFFTPSPTASPEPSDDELDELDEEDREELVKAVVNEKVAPSCGSVVATKVKVEEDVVEDDCAESSGDEDDGSPLFSMWTGKFEKMPRPSQEKKSPCDENKTSPRDHQPDMTVRGLRPITPPTSPILLLDGSSTRVHKDVAALSRSSMSTYPNHLHHHAPNLLINPFSPSSPPFSMPLDDIAYITSPLYDGFLIASSSSSSYALSGYELNANDDRYRMEVDELLNEDIWKNAEF